MRFEAAVQTLHLSKSASSGGVFESFQAALSNAANEDSSWWSGSSTLANSSVDTDTDASVSAQSSSSAVSDRTLDVTSQSATADVDSSDEGIAPARLDQATSSSDSNSNGSQASSERAAVSGSSAGASAGPGATGLDASEGVLVTIDASSDGFMETELLAAVCLGRISKVADFDVPDGPNVQRNRRIYQQDDLLACLASCAHLLFPLPSCLWQSSASLFKSNCVCISMSCSS